MPIATTYFLKGQIPNATIDDLLRLYNLAILEQGAGKTSIRENSVEFEGRSWFSPRSGRKFSGFRGGLLTIEETPTTFEVTLEAQWPLWVPLFDVYFESLRNDIERELQS
jgi:hypothetical protein